MKSIKTVDEINQNSGDIPKRKEELLCSLLVDLFVENHVQKCIEILVLEQLFIAFSIHLDKY